MMEKVASLAEVEFSRACYIVFKRIFDIVASLVALIILAPVFFITVIAIRVDSKGKAIFTQNRIGLNGKEFKFYKFRSMVINADEILAEIMKDEDSDLAKEYKENKKFRDDPRVTKVGKFIRRFSIDELPQLLNILKGDMSFIGNRPYLPREKEDMGKYFDDIVKTKPGLTGYWQVSGRSDLSFKKRVKLESEYSNMMSFSLDMKIFFKTFKVVLGSKGSR